MALPSRPRSRTRGGLAWPSSRTPSRRRPPSPWARRPPRAARARDGCPRTLGYDPVRSSSTATWRAWVARARERRLPAGLQPLRGDEQPGGRGARRRALVELLGLPLTGRPVRDARAVSPEGPRERRPPRHGVPVPPWILARPDEPPGPWRRYPAIVKPAGRGRVVRDRSDSVVRDRAALEAVLARGCQQWGRMLVQRFIRGREFNLAIVGGRVLPHAEIDFSTCPAGCHRSSYAAKWDYSSPRSVEPSPYAPRACRRAWPRG